MLKRIAVKNPTKEVRLIWRRAMLALIIIGLLLFCLVIRLGYLQIYKQNLYSTLSKKNALELIPVEPTRGLIYDRNGVVLAENIPIFSLDIAPYKVANITKTLAELGNIIALSSYDLQQFQKQLKQHRHFDDIPLKLRLSEEEVARFAENQHRFSGVFIKARLMRHYPFGESFSHVLGYVGRINTKELDEIDVANYSGSYYIGKLGIEKYYEEELHGTTGYQEVENDASGKAVRTLKEIKPVPGKNLYLAIDSSLQLAIEKALIGYRGAVVAIEPATGYILAMVSAPGYDPNTFVSGVSQQEYQTLKNSLDKPLYNRALRGLYPLASTIKPFLALEGLDSGVTTPDFTIFDPGWFQLKNNEHIFHDWRHHGHGTVDITRAITSSCDTYFYDLAVKLGIRRIDAILERFGFGKPTGIDMGEEVPGVVPSPDWKRHVKGVSWYPGDTVISGIGQGFMQVTPLQLAAATATLANRGQRFEPALLLAEQEPGKINIPSPPTPIDPVLLANPAHWDIVINAMQEVVNSSQGTAYRFGAHPTYTLAAKTGTAQLSTLRRDEEGIAEKNLAPQLRDHSLFIVFAPAEKPQIALAIVLEHSTMAVEIARNILDEYFKVAQQPMAKS